MKILFLIVVFTISGCALKIRTKSECSGCVRYGDAIKLKGTSEGGITMEAPSVIEKYEDEEE